MLLSINWFPLLLLLLSVIDKYIFYACETLKDMEYFLKILEKLGPFAFTGCRSLESIRFANDCPIKGIPYSCSLFCDHLTIVVLSDKINFISTRSFCLYEKMFTTKSFNTVKVIGKEAL